MTSDSSGQEAGEKSKKKKRIRKSLLLMAVVLAIGIPACWFLWVLVYAFSSGPLPAHQSRSSQQKELSESKSAQPEEGIFITIPPNSGLYKIRRILVAEGVIKNDKRFIQTARLFDVTNKLKSGQYYIQYGWSPYRILRELEAGRVVQQSLTVPEGNTMYQIAEMFDAKGIVKKEAFLALVKDPEYIHGLGLDVDSLEGYLFPDTYRLSHGQRADFVIRLMVKHMSEVFKELGVDKDRNIPDHMEEVFTRHEVLTLASIVEKETAQGDERPLIARVFLNRLHRGMRLQTDPTVIYGLQNFDGNLRIKDLETLTPYNTYRIRGLPPGPIGSPGKAAIEAVLHPSKESYLYFVSKNNGTHYFSKSLIEHNQAVIKYQKSRKYRRREKTADNTNK